MIINKDIDGGKAFDWGRVSSDYAKYRDIYPPVFYEKILSRGLVGEGRRVLDLGTGTGVLPRNLRRYGGIWTGTDISEGQIAEAKKLSFGTDIEYFAVPAEELGFAADTFDTATACQCFWYFDQKKMMPELYRMLKAGGSLLVLYMAWLPYEDRIAGESEKLVLKYNPGWSGAGETVHPIHIPDICFDYFEPVFHEEYRLPVHFTRESWHGRMIACRGTGASLSPEELADWEKEHIDMLNRIAPEEFDIAHYAAMVELKSLKKH